MEKPFYLQSGNVFALPIIHYNMEMAALAFELFHYLKPKAVAVELAETMEKEIIKAASRLPDISIVSTDSAKGDRTIYLIEPCDACFEGLRCASENNIPSYCIDLDLDDYPLMKDPFPDPYAVRKIGLEKYYGLYKEHISQKRFLEDNSRENHMAKKLKELSLRYDSVLFIGGMFHVEEVLKGLKSKFFKEEFPVKRGPISLSTPSEDSMRHIMGEYGFITKHYEASRESSSPFPDRQRLTLDLYKEASKNYIENTHTTFPLYNLKNVMKYARNLSLISGGLIPDLHQVITAAKGAVDSNFGYEVWELATEYPFYKNIDNLEEEEIYPDQIWGNSKTIRFHLKLKSQKSLFGYTKRKDKSKYKFYPPSEFSICSFPKEDVRIENFGRFLQKKALQVLSELGSKTIEFSGSLEDGIDIKETLRHFYEKKLYVKTKGKPPSGIGSLVVIFDEDSPDEGEKFEEKFPWVTTWIGEHGQESDMAFYATPITQNVIGPGISSCEYGGFLMSYPPERLQDVWHDPDYEGCRTKSEILLAAAIDYAIHPVIVYVSGRPPRALFKDIAKRYGKTIAYIPIGSISSLMLQKIKRFHVLDGHDKRAIADEFIN